MSENTITGALRRLGFSGDEMTAHGFRAMASTLLNESGKWSPDAIERALAHKDRDIVRAVYHRGAHWKERTAMAQWCPAGTRMRPSHARKNGKLYRYYVSADLIEQTVAGGACGWRIPAGEIEVVVAQALAARLREPGLLSEILHHSEIGKDASRTLIDRIATIAAQLDLPGSARSQDLLRSMVTRVELTATELRAEARFPPLHDATDADPVDLIPSELPPVSLTAPIAIQRRGPELRLVLRGAAAPAPQPDALLLKTLIEGRIRAADYLDPDRGMTVSAIARREGADVGDVSRSLQLAFLVPDLVERILDGTQPAALTAERLKRAGELPLLWDEQRQLFS